MGNNEAYNSFRMQTDTFRPRVIMLNIEKIEKAEFFWRCPETPPES